MEEIDIQKFVTGFQITNFKSISKTATIPFKPITLLFGPNSSGKSSIIQSLLLLKQTLEESSSISTVILSKGSYTKLGNFKDFINKNDLSKKIIFSFSIHLPDNVSFESIFPPDPNTFEYEKNDAYYFFLNLLNNHSDFQVDISISFDLLRLTVQFNSLCLYFNGDSQPLITYNNINNDFVITCINNNSEFLIKIVKFLFLNLFFKNTVNSAEDIDKIVNNFDFIFDPAKFPEIYNEISKIKEYLINLTPLSYKGDFEFNLDVNEITGHKYIDLLNERKIFYKNFLITGTVDSYLSYYASNENATHINIVTYSICYCIECFLKNIIYLGPFRALPERYYEVTGDIPLSVGHKGESFPVLLSRNPELQNKLNHLLGDFNIDYELKIVRLSMSDSIMEDLFSLRLINKKTGVESSIRDVGFGLSQLLPIILQSVIAKNSFLIIEQPELHIHPALQTQLGDLFINSSLGESKNRFLIETHSEHLILRILRRIRETTAKELPEHVAPITSNDICVLYVEPSSEGSIVKELKVDENGEFLDWWPGGFFTERAEELF